MSYPSCWQEIFIYSHVWFYSDFSDIYWSLQALTCSLSLWSCLTLMLHLMLSPPLRSHYSVFLSCASLIIYRWIFKMLTFLFFLFTLNKFLTGFAYQTWKSGLWIFDWTLWWSMPAPFYYNFDGSDLALAIIFRTLYLLHWSHILKLGDLLGEEASWRTI